MSLRLRPRRRQPLLPARKGLLCWPRLGCAVLHRREFLVVARPAGRDNRQPPGMQEPLHLPVTSRLICGVHGLVILPEELGAFPLRQVPENNPRVIPILNLDRLGGHAIEVTPGPGPYPHPSGFAPPGGGASGPRCGRPLIPAGPRGPARR